MSGTQLTYGAFSDFLEKAILNHVFGGTAYAQPAGLWVALYTNQAVDGVAGSEPPGATGYTRMPVTFAAAPDQPDGSSAMFNSAVVQFPPATALWGTLLSCGIHDAVSGGNRLAMGPLVTVKIVDTGDSVRFAANALLIGLQ